MNTWQSQPTNTSNTLKIKIYKKKKHAHNEIAWSAQLNHSDQAEVISVFAITFLGSIWVKPLAIESRSKSTKEVLLWKNTHNDAKSATQTHY